MKFLKLSAAILLSTYYLLLASGMIAMVAGINLLTKPAADSQKETIFVIKEGESFRKIAEGLEKAGLLRSRYLIYPLAWINMEMSSLRAGKYRLNSSMKPDEILKCLVEGRVITKLITIPEGYNIYQIARIVERSGFDKKEGFLGAARDPGFLKSIGIKHDSAEGYLFPDSYLFEEETDSREIITVMSRRFFSIWKENNFSERAKDMGLNMFKTIILASIVEKEAMVDEEKPVIASVFLNRIRKKMPLQADPTVKYGIIVERQVNRKRLRTRDLRHLTPYNTYRIKGLPAGPISNPGLVSIKAVLFPAETDYLFFVSMNNGRHKFSVKLREHNKAVQKYQLGKD